MDFNLTYATSEADFGTGQDEFPLPKAPEYTANLSLTYENLENGLTVILAGAYRDAVFAKFESGEDIWLDETFHVDFSAIYQATDQFGLKLSLNNLTDEANTELEEEPGTRFSRIHETESYGMSATLGLEYVF